MSSPPAVVVAIPALLPHQEADVFHPARFKVLRKGRRWGKDHLAFHVAWFGHGPAYRWPGILEGWNVAWLAPDFKQGRIIWEEEIRERLDGVPGITLNEQEHTAILAGLGGLYVFSAENVLSIRGLGKRLKGVIINEASRLDLAYAWRHVIRPALMDNHGWALILSTSNSGTDGGLDEQNNRRVPSYFNTLCEEIQTGRRDAEWMQSSGTAEENPKIGASEFSSLIAEYPQDSTALQEEVYARLLAPGSGLAFPEWRDGIHVVERFSVPAHWEFGAGFDWGYWQPSAFVLLACGEESQTVALSELRWTQTDGYRMGEDIGMLAASLDRPLIAIAADSSMWGVVAKKGFPNQAEEVQAGIDAAWKRGSKNGSGPRLWAVPKSKESRIMRASLLHKYLRIPEGGAPRLRFLSACRSCISTIPKLPPDRKRPEDVDTQSDDHFYDALTEFLLSRPPLVDVPPEPRTSEDQHPGLEVRYRRQLQAMGLLPGAEHAERARYKGSKPRRRL